MGLGQKIKMYRERAGLTQEELGKAVGVSSMAVSQWENDRAVPRMGSITKLSDVLKVNLSDLLDEKHSNSHATISETHKAMLDYLLGLNPDSSTGKSDSKFTETPVYGSIAAGTPIEMIEAESTHPIPVHIHNKYPNAFLLKVEGNSMDRILPDGCYALIDPCNEITHDNEPYAICVNGHDATVKRVRKLAHGFQLIPDSTDPTYTPKTYNYNEEGTEQITVIGQVVWFCIPFDWEF